eukprot:jgi/Mesvir1/20166/Mv25413-RA.1
MRGCVAGWVRHCVAGWLCGCVGGWMAGSAWLRVQWDANMLLPLDATVHGFFCSHAGAAVFPIDVVKTDVAKKDDAITLGHV